MVCKTSLSNLVRGLPIANDLNLIYSILGKPLTDNGKQIGAIIGVDLKSDTITIEIDDRYADIISSCEFAKTSSFEIAGGKVR